MENISESLVIKTTNIIPCHLFFFSPQSIYPTYEDIPKYTEYLRTFLGNEKKKYIIKNEDRFSTQKGTTWLSSLNIGEETVCDWSSKQSLFRSIKDGQKGLKNEV